LLVTDVTMCFGLSGAADEAGTSRHYGGSHRSMDDVPSSDLGKKCGEPAFSLAKSYWRG